MAGRGGVIARQLPAGLQTGNGSRYRRILPDAVLEQTNGMLRDPRCNNGTLEHQNCAQSCAANKKTVG